MGVDRELPSCSSVSYLELPLHISLEGRVLLLSKLLEARGFRKDAG